MLSTMEKILFLQRVPMFEGLSSRHLRVIADIAEEEQISRGQVIFEEGQPGEKMYIIVDGQVQIDKAVDGGKPVVLVTLEKRDLLGDMAILDDEPRSASARTLSDSRLLGVGSGPLHELIRDFPDIAFGLLKFCAQRIRDSNKRLQAMSSGTAAGAGGARGARLTVLTGPDRGKSFVATTPHVALGRSGGEEIEALDRFTFRDAAKQVSRNHAEVVKQGAGWSVRDCGSVNGTYVNDQRIQAPTPLRNGDVIRLGAEASVRFEG